jgi:hypothetical protein
VLPYRKPRQKRGDLRGTQRGGMRLPMKHDIPPDPMDVRLLGPATVVSDADSVPDTIQELWLGPA